MFSTRNEVRSSTLHMLYGVIVIALMTSCVKIERRLELAGPEEPIYYMIGRGEPLEEIEKALRERPHIVRSFIYQEETLLSCAAGEGREDVVELLLSMGARPNGPSDKCSPLMSGISSENPDVVRVLLDHGASPFLPQQPFGFTPYEIGIKYGNERIVELLRQAKMRRAKELDRDYRKTHNLDNSHGDD